MDIVNGANTRPSSSASPAVPDYRALRKNDLRACAARLGVRTRRQSAASRSRDWRKVGDLVVDCEKAARRAGQPTLKSFFTMKRAMSGRASGSSSCDIATIQGLRLDADGATSEDSATHRNAALISVLRDIKPIAAFRKHAQALNLMVRVPKADGEGTRWRSKADILGEYAHMLEDAASHRVR